MNANDTMLRRFFRCKSIDGYSIHGTIGPTKSGKFKALSASKPKLRGQPIPSDFLPFSILDAVYGHVDFETADAAERYVRSL